MWAILAFAATILALAVVQSGCLASSSAALATELIELLGPSEVDLAAVFVPRPADITDATPWSRARRPQKGLSC